jgi:hypothetical protein
VCVRACGEHVARDGREQAGLVVLVSDQDLIFAVEVSNGSEKLTGAAAIRRSEKNRRADNPDARAEARLPSVRAPKIIFRNAGEGSFLRPKTPLFGRSPANWVERGRGASSAVQRGETL